MPPKYNKLRDSNSKNYYHSENFASKNEKDYLSNII